MNATFKDIEKYLSNNKPDNIRISEKEIIFFAGIFDFVITPRYDSMREDSYFEIEVVVI